jgi:hypothetical protein
LPKTPRWQDYRREQSDEHHMLRKWHGYPDFAGGAPKEGHRCVTVKAGKAQHPLWNMDKNRQVSYGERTYGRTTSLSR